MQYFILNSTGLDSRVKVCAGGAIGDLNGWVQTQIEKNRRVTQFVLRRLPINQIKIIHMDDYKNDR
ncbi:MAG: hypothetical protein ACU85E_18055, partial [Gammaproteobacteria bacterium]